ncbi:alanine racemase [Lacrimispora celerecrescens]|uniref:Putative amino acid racemase n=1 Tax=[Clostridium] celerecrescens 18A TaxID=1286362 RepID=A0A2M8Z3X4_9FIRM|nr:alanine racemase [Lacrimispora celerecrescens]PJJ28127.1 putative amino acid racemase [[Clostridium] celerecrescens 18A]
MFLEQTLKRNPELIKASFELHQSGLIQPDSYVIDVDTFLDNAAFMLKEAKKKEIRLFFMLKQAGRNPYLAGKLVELGYEGAVVVDYKEAKVMMDHQIPIANVGHLVQIPTAQVEEIVAYRPQLITVYSEEKISQIHQAAKKLGLSQEIILRVTSDSDMIYSGQTAGFHIDALKVLAERVKTQYPCVRIAGVTSFPCFLYEETAHDLNPTNNMDTVRFAAKILKECGIQVTIVNTPSGSCTYALNKIREMGGNCAEPGHGLTGTTPMHAYHMLEEVPCVTYVSEISHNFKRQAYCFGGGYYRRSHVKSALVGTSFDNYTEMGIIPPSNESIDYHFGLTKEGTVGDTVVMAFRYQIFVTRSDVVLLEGLKKKKPQIVGIYDSMGKKL